MDQTWKVFLDFHVMDTLKHDEDCLPLYRNLCVVIWSIQVTHTKKKNEMLWNIIILSTFVYWNWCFCRRCGYILVCMYTHACA